MCEFIRVYIRENVYIVNRSTYSIEKITNEIIANIYRRESLSLEISNNESDQRTYVLF